MSNPIPISSLTELVLRSALRVVMFALEPRRCLSVNTICQLKLSPILFVYNSTFNFKRHAIPVFPYNSWSYLLLRFNFARGIYAKS